MRLEVWPCCCGFLYLLLLKRLRLRGRCASTSPPATCSIPSIPITHSAARSMSCLTPKSTGSTPRTSSRNRCRRGGVPSPIVITPSCAWPHGTGLRTGTGAIRPIRADTLPAVRNSKIPSVTFSPTLCRTAVSPRAATGRCKVPISAIGKVIRISPASSPARVTPPTRNGWLWICKRRMR